MNNIKKILLFLLCLTYVQTAVAVLPIQVEVKVFGKDVVFIFYRDKDQIIDLQSRGAQAIANINIPSEFKLLNPHQFNKYASDIRSTANKQRITFWVNKGLKYQGVINGEKLDAIKFRAEKKKDEGNLANLGAAKNDPGAIKYSQKNDSHKLSFNLGGNDSKIASFIRGKYLWIIFDQKKIFSFEEGGIFSQFELVPSEEGTVMRMKIDPEFAYAQVKKVESGWDVNVTKQIDEKYILQNVVHPEPISDADGFLIRGDFEDNKIISFIDPELGDVVNVMPVKTKGARVEKQIDSIEFSLLNSIQGIAIILYSDDVDVEKHPDSIKVISDTALPEDLLVQTDKFAKNISEYLDLPTILPYLDKNLDILDFNEQKSRLISEASMSRDNSSSFSSNLELAKFFYIHGWYKEAIDALKVAQKYSDNDYQQSLQARFLKAVSLSLVGEHAAAKEEYDDLLSYSDLRKITEINIWNNYNEFALGSRTKSIGVIDALSKPLSLYSGDKYWPLIFAEIELAIMANEMKLVERLFRESRFPEIEKHANNLKFFKAQYYKKKKQLNLAKQYYRELSYQDTDLFNRVRSEFELTKLRKDTDEISTSDAIQILERLRYDWRGDQLEYEILMQLAAYYRDSKDIMNSLRTYKYIQSAFNNKISNFYITSEMARIFNDVFLPEGTGEEMDDFTIVALFYEFKELNPIGAQGDDVIIEIAKRLVRLDLLENASELLRHQINYRLKGAKRVTNADYLAIVLMLDKKPSEAILVLDSTDEDNFNFEEHQYRVRLRSRALIALEKYEEALSYLEDDNSDEARMIRREALFQAKKWSIYADEVGLDSEDIVSKVGEDQAAAQDILRLAISYYKLGMNDQLNLIANQIGNLNAPLRTIVDLLISSSGSIDYRDLDKSLDIDQMKTLLDKYKNQFLNAKGK